MFIPTWLVVLIVVFVLLAFWPGVWSELKTLALAIYALLVVVSIPATLYFLFVRDRDSAFVAAIPLLALIGWETLKGSVESVRTSAWLHDLRVRRASTPTEIATLRRGYANALGLAGKLWTFREDVKYFPSWYGKTLTDGTPWASNVIAKSDIVEVKRRHGAPDGFEADLSALRINPPCLIYRFDAGGSVYHFCASDNAEPLLNFDDHDGHLNTCGVWVVEGRDKLVLSLHLPYYVGEYAHTLASERSYVEAFKPGPWLDALLSIAARVRADETEKHERWRKESEARRAQENFT
jgi:hypothetical protein